MATLYELNEKIAAILENGFVVDEETGEYFDADALEELDEAWDTKAENIALFLKNMKSDVEAIKNEIDNLTERKKTLENKTAKLEEYFIQNLQKRELKKFETAKAAVTVRSSTRTIVDENALEDKWFNVTVVKKPDKTAIKNALKANEEVAGAHLETAYSLNIK